MAIFLGFFTNLLIDIFCKDKIPYDLFGPYINKISSTPLELLPNEVSLCFFLLTVIHKF